MMSLMHNRSSVALFRYASRHLAGAGIALLLIHSPIRAEASQAPMIAPRAGPLPAGNGFDLRPKIRRSVSGLACPDQGRGRCLIVFDEGVEARFAELGEDVLKPLPGAVHLLLRSGELDAEGAATDGRHFYVTGSHSVKRGDCSSNADSRHVVRFPVEAVASRRAPNADAGSTTPPGYEVTRRLWDIMLAEPLLKNHVGKCLGSLPPKDKPKLQGGRGVNIEGLAIKEGRLFFGFRGPAVGGTAVILSLDADALFNGNAARATAAKIRVGEGRGVRDLQSVRDGILMLIGPDDDREGDKAAWEIALWDGRPANNAEIHPRPLARLDLSGVRMRPDCDKDLKPEAMAVRRESERLYHVVVLSDGMCDGGALLFDVPR
jgi:hypothetical protein